jgi:hypothetical protein
LPVDSAGGSGRPESGVSAAVLDAGVPSTSRKSAVSGSRAPEVAELGVSALSESEPGGVVEDITTAG